MGKTAIPGAQRGTTFKMDPDKIFIPGLDSKPGAPEHDLHDERAFEPPDPALVKDIRVNGQDTPVIVRKDGDTVELVAGRRRTVACREIKKEDPEFRIEVKLEKLTNREAFRVMATENSLRKDTTIYQKAVLCQKGRRVFKMTDQELADMHGEKVPTVKQWMQLFDLDDSIVEDVKKGKAGLTAVVKLATLSREEQVKEYKAMKERGETTAEAARIAVNRVKQTKASANGKPSKPTQTTKKIPAALVRKLVLAQGKLDAEDAPLPFGGKPEVAEAILLGMRIAHGFTVTSVVPGLDDFIAEVTGKRGK